MPPTTRASAKPQPVPPPAEGAEGSQHALVIPLPRLPHVPMPHVGVPHVSRPHVGAPAMSGRTGRALWLGGLGVLAIAGVIEWPVAGVVAVGAWVAEQRARAVRGPGATPIRSAVPPTPEE